LTLLILITSENPPQHSSECVRTPPEKLPCLGRELSQSDTDSPLTAAGYSRRLSRSEILLFSASVGLWRDL